METKTRTVAGRITEADYKKIIKKHKKFSLWLTKVVAFEINGLTKPLDKALWEIENRVAIQSYLKDDHELDPVLEKKVELAREKG